MSLKDSTTPTDAQTVIPGNQPAIPNVEIAGPGIPRDEVASVAYREEPGRPIGTRHEDRAERAIKDSGEKADEAEVKDPPLNLTKRMSKTRIIVGLGVALISILVGRIAWQTLRPHPSTGLLQASGRIEGRITLVAPRTTGTVAKILVDEGRRVAANELLAVLNEPAIRSRLKAGEETLAGFGKKLEAADRNLVLLQSQVALQEESAEAGVREAQARLDRVRASAAQASIDADRARNLLASDDISRQSAEMTILKAATERNAITEAEAGLDRARKQLQLANLGRQQVDAQRAERDALARQLTQAGATAEEQRSYVEDFQIRSPLAGVVLTRNVEKGERVSPGTPLFTLVNLDQLYLKIYIPETEIGKVALGQEARVYVDAYPDHALPARVSKVANQAEFTPKNVETKEDRVKLVYAVELVPEENPGGLLKPGMPADAVIRIDPKAAWAHQIQ